MLIAFVAAGRVTEILGIVDTHIHAKLRNIREIAAMLNGESKNEISTSWQ